MRLSNTEATFFDTEETFWGFKIENWKERLFMVSEMYAIILY